MMARWSRRRTRVLGDVVSVLVVASALALPAWLWLLHDALGSALDARGSGSVVLFLEPGEDAAAIERRLRADGPLQASEFLDAAAARQAFADFLGLEPDAPGLQGLELPPTLTVQLPAGLEAAASAARVEGWERLPGVASLWWDRAELERSQALYRSLRRIGLGLTLVLVAAGLAIVAGSVAGRMAQERPTITVLTLLGANDGFILRPHLVHSVLLGVLAAALAALLLTLGAQALATPLAAIQQALGVAVAAPQVGAGALLALFFAAPLLAGGTTALVVGWQLEQMRRGDGRA